MNIRQVNELLTFSDALNSAELSRLQATDYQLVISNRPDEEGGEHPLHQDEKAILAANGIDYCYLPFTFATLTWEQVYRFHHLVSSGKKILAHCLTGVRSVAIYLLHDLKEGLIDEARFRQLCQQYQGDADIALSWYAHRQQHEPVAEVHPFYEPVSGSLQYVVADPQSRRCAIIDPVLDFDRNAAAVSYQQAQRLLDFIAERQWQLAWILDTHPHADHVSAAAWLAQQTGAPAAMGEKVAEVQALWKTLYHLPNLPAPETLWQRLFHDGERFYIGNLAASVIFSPGHTLASVTYHIGNCAFIHDTLFMPDSGTARADFPGGSADDLWDSLQRILALPADTRLFTGHDYRPGGREVQYESTIAQQRQQNSWLAAADKDAFIARRRERDAALPLPGLMLMALQMNINGGRLPEPETDGQRYLKIPLNRF